MNDFLAVPAKTVLAKELANPASPTVAALNATILEQTAGKLDIATAEVQFSTAYSDMAAPLAANVLFVKDPANPIFDTDDTTAKGFSTLLWPWVVDMRGRAGRLADFYLYFSTDHAGAGGQIGLAYTSDPDLKPGTWTIHGVVYKYTVSGNETETPAVMKLDNGNLILYTQQVAPTGAIAAQVTMYATSTDGITWTPGGIALDIPAASEYPTSAHTGYFRPFRIGDSWIAYSLLSGTSGARFGISYSQDGIKWTLDPRPLGFGAEWLPVGERIEWNTSNVVIWRGQYVWIGLISSFASGAESRTSYFAMAPLAPDFRSLAGKPRKLFGATQAWETSYMQQGHAFVLDGKLMLVYRSGQGDGTTNHAFGIAKVGAV